MLMKMIAVKDTKVAAFDQPFTVRHTGDALRQWDVVTKDPKTKFGQHPADYELYEIGTYDDETAQISMHSPYIHLANGVTQ